LEQLTAQHFQVEPSLAVLSQEAHMQQPVQQSQEITQQQLEQAEHLMSVTAQTLSSHLPTMLAQVI
jgi:hypothetical protein